MLPLRPNANVLVAGDGADNIPKQNGGWTLTWQGTGITNAHFPKAQSIFAGIREAVDAGGGTATLSVTGAYKTRPDVAIVVFGEDPYAEFQGDIDTLEYKPGDESDLALLRKLQARRRFPVVAVFLSGRPLWVNPELNAVRRLRRRMAAGLRRRRHRRRAVHAAPTARCTMTSRASCRSRWPRTPLQTTASPARNRSCSRYGFGLTYADDGALPQLSEVVPARPDAAASHRGPTLQPANPAAAGRSRSVKAKARTALDAAASTGGTHPERCA